MIEDTDRKSIFETALGLWQRRRWLLIVSFSMSLCLAVSLIMALPSMYRSSTTILFGQDDITESLVKSSAPNELEVRLGIIRQTVLSRSHLQDVIDTFDLYRPLRANAPPELAIEQLRRDIHIEQRASAQPQWGKDTTFALSIRYQGRDAELVARVANDLAARFEAENEKIRTGQAQRTTEFIAQQLGVSKQNFLSQESRVNAFRNDHMGELPEQQQTNLVTLERLNSALSLNGERQIQLLNQLESTRFDSAGGEPATAGAGMSDGQRLAWLNRRLATLQASYTDIYPGIIHLQREIKTLTKEISDKAQRENSSTEVSTVGQHPSDMNRALLGLRREEAKLNGAIASLMRRVAATPKIDQQLKQFAHDYESAKEGYLSMQKKYQAAQLAQSLETEQNQQVRVVEVAIPSAFPAAPNRPKLIFMAFILAAGFAGFVLFLAEQLDQSFHDLTDIRHFTSIPVLASISTIETAGGRVRSGVRFVLASVVVISGLLFVSGVGYHVGKSAEQVVWAI